MGSAFQQLTYRSHSNIQRYEKLFHDSHSNASLLNTRRFATLKGSETRFAELSSEFLHPSTARLLLLSTRSRIQNNATSKKSPTTQWRCCDAGATEVSPSAVSFEIVGSGPKSENSTSPSAQTATPALRVPIDLGDRYTEAGIEVVKSLEEAENEILKVVVLPVENPPAETRQDGGVSTLLSIPLEDSELSATAAATIVSEAAEAIRPDRAGVLQSLESRPTLVEDRPVNDATTSEGTLFAESVAAEKLDVLQDFGTSILIEEHNAINDGSLQFLEADEQSAKGILQQMWDIIMFAGPALGIWLSGPMMSLIDTAVVGNSSSLELAALGPGTVFCDQLSYVFMFLSVATSNLIATSLAKQDRSEAAHHLSRLLFVALACGIGMFLLTGAFSMQLLKAFVGPQNVSLVPAAHTYVKIRALAWPAVLVGMVAQSASLGMQDSWSPLKVLAVASFANLSGDIFFCSVLGYGIAGAAWTTMFSQYIGGYLMLRSLNRKGYNALALSIPSSKEFAHMIELAAPVLLTMLSKVSFYSFITYLSTSLGAVTLAAHQVMIGIYSTCTVSGEPLCQTAQSFMPALIQGTNQNLSKARSLLKSLLLIGAMCGVFLGCVAICFPWVFPQVFTRDGAVISQMRAVTVPFLWSLVMTPPLLSLEGTLLAGRDLKFLSLSMVSCFLGGSALLMVLKTQGFGLQSFWWVLASFQSARFVMAFFRLHSAKSVLRDPQTVAKQSSPHLKRT